LAASVPTQVALTSIPRLNFPVLISLSQAKILALYGMVDAQTIESRNSQSIPPEHQSCGVPTARQIHRPAAKRFGN
jgi:hypothetical protein